MATDVGYVGPGSFLTGCLALLLGLTACGGGSAAVGARTSAVGTSAAWESIVAAGTREGKLVIIGPVGSEVQQALTQPFHQKYPQIEVSFSAPPTPQIPPKLLTEQAAGQYSTDVLVTGPTTILQTLLPANALMALKPLLTDAPDVQDMNKWRGGKLTWEDDQGEYGLISLARVQIPFTHNTSLVKAGDLTSWKDLLDPKWKGKIVSLDPSKPGGSLDIATFIYGRPELGKEFLKQLYGGQDVQLSSDARQMIDMAAQGTRPIGIGVDSATTLEMKARGLPIDAYPPELLREGAVMSSSNANLAALAKAPHPNALKLYLNHMLSPEGQLAWSKASGLASFRSDVPRDHLPASIVPKENVTYEENFHQEYQSRTTQVVDYLKTVLPS